MRILASSVVLGAVVFSTARAAAEEPSPSLPPPGSSAPSAPSSAAPTVAAPPPLPPPEPGAAAPSAAAPPAAGGASNGQLPPPQSQAASPLVEGQNLTGTPNPSALSPSAADEWRFAFHGFSRYPMRIGIGNRPACPAGVSAGTNLTPSGGMPAMDATTKGEPQVPCAGPGQSRTALHTPFTPDTQYLDWRYDRQQEYDWTELFFNYGNSMVTGTVAINAFGFSDAEYIGWSNAASQLGIAQAFLTIHPDLGLSNLRFTAKVGSFWDKYGMAGQYDAGKYDTYMFGRTHQMGETLAAEYTVDDYTFRLSHGIGTRAEQVAFTQLQYGLPTFPGGSENNYPGFTLLNHAHAGVSYKKTLDVNAHYLSSWAQDYRAVGVANGTITDGHIDVYGGEATVRMGPLGGRLYVAYSRIVAANPQAVGPVIEAVHSLGGGNYESGNGVLDNFFGCTNAGGSGTPNPTSGNCETVQNSIGASHGTVDTIEIQYEYGLGTLIKRLADSNAQWDAYLALFGMFSSVTSTLQPGTDPLTTTGTTLLGNGVKKLKYGADLIITPLQWLGFGARTDIVQPTDKDPGAGQQFWVISPKVIFKTKWVTHEEVTAWYSHYSYGANVLPQPPNGVVNPNTSPTTPPGPFPPDENVVGIKGTIWW
jgi:hypothetical protein